MCQHSLKEVFAIFSDDAVEGEASLVHGHDEMGVDDLFLGPVFIEQLDIFEVEGVDTFGFVIYDTVFIVRVSSLSILMLVKFLNFVVVIRIFIGVGFSGDEICKRF